MSWSSNNGQPAKTGEDQMDQRRRHYFPENDCHVITGLCPNGEYGAYREDEDEGRVRGYGHTRMAAIADMVEQLDLEDAA